MENTCPLSPVIFFFDPRQFAGPGDDGIGPKKTKRTAVGMEDVRQKGLPLQNLPMDVYLRIFLLMSHSERQKLARVNHEIQKIIYCSFFRWNFTLQDGTEATNSMLEQMETSRARGIECFGLEITSEYGLDFFLSDILHKKMTKIQAIITHLVLGGDFNQSIDLRNTSITSLHLNRSFDQPVDKLPKGLTKLTFDNKSLFNQPVNALPDSIKTIVFGCGFNQPVDGLLPKSLVYLAFGHYSLFNIHHFDQSVDNLPDSIKYIYFGWAFNQSVDNLPKELTRLVFYPGSLFDQSVCNLPEGLTELVFGEYFDQSVDKLPERLIRLAFCEKSRFYHTVNKLPESLRELKFGRHFNRYVNELPKGLLEIVYR